MRASQVNRAWNRATHHPRLFHRLCCSPEWSLPNLDADFPPPLECRNANFFFPNLPSPTAVTTTDNTEPSDGVDVGRLSKRVVVTGMMYQLLKVLCVHFLSSGSKNSSGAIRCAKTGSEGSIEYGDLLGIQEASGVIAFDGTSNPHPIWCLSE